MKHRCPSGLSTLGAVATDDEIERAGLARQLLRGPLLGAHRGQPALHRRVAHHGKHVAREVVGHHFTRMGRHGKAGVAGPATHVQYARIGRQRRRECRQVLQILPTCVYRAFQVGLCARAELPVDLVVMFHGARSCCGGQQS